MITATQMLNSMEHSSRPTRAEASDVFNAVLDGTDAVMLSGESAIGDYPVEAVTTMRQICTEAEAYLKTEGGRWQVEAAPLSGLIDSTMEACVDAAAAMTRRLDAALIVVSAATGRPARALANRRPAAPILALPPTEQMARRLCLCWGVIPAVLADDPQPSARCTSASSGRNRAASSSPASTPCCSPITSATAPTCARSWRER